VPTQRPLLFLDVDGPLLPFGAPPEQYPTYGAADSNPLLARLDPHHGPRLTALGYDLVWATTWVHEANESIAPRLGLPPSAVVTWPEPTTAEDDHDERNGLHWKTRTLVTWAANRPFAWVDDEITPADRAWVAAHHRGPALLHRVDPRRGLTDTDYATLGEWSRETRRRSLPHTQDTA